MTYDENNWYCLIYKTLLGERRYNTLNCVIIQLLHIKAPKE